MWCFQPIPDGMPEGDPEEWTARQVKQWFKHKDLVYDRCLRDVNGKKLLEMKEEDLARLLGERRAHIVFYDFHHASFKMSPENDGQNSTPDLSKTVDHSSVEAEKQDGQGDAAAAQQDSVIEAALPESSCSGPAVSPSLDASLSDSCSSRQAEDTECLEKGVAAQQQAAAGKGSSRQTLKGSKVEDSAGEHGLGDVAALQQDQQFSTAEVQGRE